MTRKLLCFQYPPFMHTETSQMLFSSVATFDVQWDALPSNSDFDLLKLRIKNTGITLHDFDVVALVSLDNTKLFSAEIVHGMRDLIQDALQTPWKPILLLGINFDLPDPFYSQQLVLFDGWFIGKTNSTEQLRSLLSRFFGS